MKHIFFCKYWENGQRYCDTFSLSTKGGKYFMHYYQNLGNMRSEIPAIQYARLLILWEAKIGKYHEHGHLGKWEHTTENI